MRSDPGQLYPVSLRLLSSAGFRKVIAANLSAGFREHMSSAKTQKRPPWQAAEREEILVRLLSQR